MQMSYKEAMERNMQIIKFSNLNQYRINSCLQNKENVVATCRETFAKLVQVISVVDWM